MNKTDIIGNSMIRGGHRTDIRQNRTMRAVKDGFEQTGQMNQIIQPIKFGQNGYTNSGRNSNGGSNGNFRENYQERYREVNRELIRYIYSTVDIAKFKYELLKNKQQLGRFISNTHYVSPNYYGKNCLLVFTKLKEKYYSFLVDRRKLSYSIDKVKMDEVFINHCNVEIDLSIYLGTIFDGVYIKKGNHHEFVINDIYTFRGIDYTGNKLNFKLFEIKTYLDNINSQIHTIRERINAKINLELKVNNIVNILDIRKFVKTDLKVLEQEYQTKGLCFYPEVSGTKLVFIMGDNKNDDNNPSNTFGGSDSCISDFNKIDDLCKDSSKDMFKDMSKDMSKDSFNDLSKVIRKGTKSSIDSDSNSDTKGKKKSGSGGNGKGFIKSKPLVKKTYAAKSAEKSIYAVLEMKGTNTVDNYKLFAVEQIKDEDGESVKLKKCQMDIAYIPNIEKSRWCKDIITSSHRGSVFVKCIWRDDKSKWEPLEVKKDVKLPSLMEDIRKDIVVVEEADSDTDGE